VLELLVVVQLAVEQLVMVLVPLELVLVVELFVVELVELVLLALVLVVLELPTLVVLLLHATGGCDGQRQRAYAMGGKLLARGQLVIVSGGGCDLSEALQWCIADAALDNGL